ncbi:TetR/AcrR family transcriptional regulator [Robbsia sp. KACC 23696]|uniref:TetR/AcrR family transcriptional regulator n=1 Tax=Robbsia sp. KACC 23696 TaxID=3149231 RepID=UPI00325B2B9A
METHIGSRDCARTARNDSDEKSVRIVDAEGHRKNILEVATAEFAAHGFAGARIDEIAAKTSCSKRMIYYYFVDKDGLYVAVLENAYRRVRQLEEAVDYDVLSPEAALRKLVAFRFSYHEKNAHFVKLVLNENMNGAHHLARSDVIVQLNQLALATVDRIYARGVHDRVFRPGISALEIHWQISAFCFYGVSNKSTFSTLFERQISVGLSFDKIKANAVDSIMRFVIL